LSGNDAVRAYQAVLALGMSPQHALPILKTHVKPVAAVPEETIRKHITDLDSGSFAVRDRATRELETIAEAAAPLLSQAIKVERPLESRRRLQAMLTHADQARTEPSGDGLRLLRALEILRRIGGDEADELIRQLASGYPGAHLTQEAKAILQRRSIKPEPEEPFIADPEPAPPQPVQEIAADEPKLQQPPESDSYVLWLTMFSILLVALFAISAILRVNKSTA